MRIAVTTAGGDAPGMNACLRAIVRDACCRGLEVLGIEEGYTGLIEDRMKPMDLRSWAVLSIAAEQFCGPEDPIR